MRTVLVLLGCQIGVLVGMVAPVPLHAQEGVTGSQIPAGEKQPVVSEAGEEPVASQELQVSSSQEPDSVAGEEQRSLADRLNASSPVPVSVPSLELSKLELYLGRYEELIDRISTLPSMPGIAIPETKTPSTPPVRPTVTPQPASLVIPLLRNLAAAHQAVGQRAEATAVYELLIQRFDDLVSKAAFARLLSGFGHFDQAEQLYYGLIRSYNQRGRLPAESLVAVGVACKELGRNNPQLFKDALRAFDQAITSYGLREQANGARGELARLFIEKYDSAQARASLQPVLEAESLAPETLMAAALIERFDGQPAARELALAALEINPNFIEALVFLAGLETEAEDREGAARYIDRALQVNPSSLPALTLSAGLAFLAEELDQFEAIRAQVLALNPNYADFWVELSLVAMRNRLYPKALEFAQAAVDLDGKSWRGWGELGLNQLRLGRIDQGRESLEKAFEGDPYNVWNKNTLDLLDELVHYRVVKTEHFELVLHESEADLLAPIVGALAERSYKSLASRYGFEAPTPIRIEVFPRHEDFSVRTVGLSGLGALGVSFGPVIAIDSPAAREIGDFNWGTTLWHEIAHTFTLGLSKGKIPRWFTEGLSVYEERQGPVGWTDDPSPDFLAAYADQRLLGLRAMNDGFIRPSFPNQIGLSYYQASLVAEYIEKTWGFGEIVGMLQAYGAGKTTEEIVKDQFNLTPEEFDTRFWAYLEERFALTLPTFRAGAATFEETDTEDPSESPKAIRLEPVGQSPVGASLEQAAADRPDDFRAQLAFGQQLLADEDWQAARAVLQRASDLFPEYAGPGSPYHGLVEVALQLDERDVAAATLRSLVDLNEYDFDAHRQLATLYEELDQPEDELEILSRSIYIYPYQPAIHERMADLAGNLGSLEQRVRSLRSVLALRPSSRPRLLFELATTFRDLGQMAAAKRSVLGALELAPSYAQAQTLLLELVDQAAEAGGNS